jgi:hypothetical protein
MSAIVCQCEHELSKVHRTSERKLHNSVPSASIHSRYARGHSTCARNSAVPDYFCFWFPENTQMLSVHEMYTITTIVSFPFFISEGTL